MPFLFLVTSYAVFGSVSWIHHPGFAVLDFIIELMKKWLPSNYSFVQFIFKLASLTSFGITIFFHTFLLKARLVNTNKGVIFIKVAIFALDLLSEIVKK